MGSTCSAQDAETPLVIESCGILSLGGAELISDSTTTIDPITSDTTTSQEKLNIQNVTSNDAFFHRDDARKRSRHWQFLKQEYRGVFCQIKLLDAQHVSDRWVGKLKDIGNWQSEDGWLMMEEVRSVTMNGVGSQETLRPILLRNIDFVEVASHLHSVHTMQGSTVNHATSSGSNAPKTTLKSQKRPLKKRFINKHEANATSGDSSYSSGHKNATDSILRINYDGSLQYKNRDGETHFDADQIEFHESGECSFHSKPAFKLHKPLANDPILPIGSIDLPDDAGKFFDRDSSESLSNPEFEGGNASVGGRAADELTVSSVDALLGSDRVSLSNCEIHELSPSPLSESDMPDVPMKPTWWKYSDADTVNSCPTADDTSSFSRVSSQGGSECPSHVSQRSIDQQRYEFKANGMKFPSHRKLGRIED